MDKQTKKEFENLVEIIKENFDAMEGKFNGLENRFDGLENRFGGLEKRFDGLENRFDGLEKKFDRLDEKMENGFLFVNKELADIKERISKLENRTIEDSDAQAEEIMKLKKRIDWLEKQFRRIQPAFAH